MSVEIIHKVPEEDKIPEIEMEGRYKNNTVFIDESGHKLYKYRDGKLYFYNTADLVLGCLDTDTVFLSNDQKCPDGYIEYSLDDDRVLMIGSNKEVGGVDKISKYIKHRHFFNQDTCYDPIGSVYAVDTCNGCVYYTTYSYRLRLSYISFKLCISKNESFKNRGRYE